MKIPRFVSLILLALPVVLGLTAGESLADTGGKKVASWNMQGATSQGILAGSENKWATSVRTLLSNDAGVDILLLQEAGAPPESAVPATGFDRITNIINPDGISNNIQQLIWGRAGTRNPGFFVYFMEVAQRVHVAIVTRTRPDALIVFANPREGPHSSARPLIGVRYGNTDYYSYHAVSAGIHNEAPEMIEHVHAYYACEPNGLSFRWMIGGDFNRDSQTLVPSLTPATAQNVTVVSQNVSPTQTSGGILDYAIIGQVGSHLSASIGAFLFIAQLAGQLASDHTPVKFGAF